MKKTFEEVRQTADHTWEDLLSRIRVQGGTERQKGLFYSCLYRSFLWPALRSDVNGDYLDARNRLANNGFRYYNDPSFWDTYRNHSIGFVFQSYNLIPHQSVLQNVELALTISGISRAERRKRAKKALEDVGLGNQLHKKPNQMSGGQMQRVAIARALVNDPDIILADEPTGNLDHETGDNIMRLLHDICKKEKMAVLMITHNEQWLKDYPGTVYRCEKQRLVRISPVAAERDAALE